MKISPEEYLQSGKKKHKYNAKTCWYFPKEDILREQPPLEGKNLEHWKESCKKSGAIRFPSLKEALRYLDLKLLEKAGEIANLELL